jgi:hypothetical protein
MKKIIAAGLLAGTALLGAATAHADGGYVAPSPQIEQWSFNKGRTLAPLAKQLMQSPRPSSDVQHWNLRNACDAALEIDINQRGDAQIASYPNFDYQSALAGCIVQLKTAG